VGRRLCIWVMSRRNSCTVMAIKTAVAIRQLRIDSFCSLYRRRWEFLFQASLRASRRGMRKRASKASYDDASRATAAQIRRHECRLRILWSNRGYWLASSVLRSFGCVSVCDEERSGNIAMLFWRRSAFEKMVYYTKWFVGGSNLKTISKQHMRGFVILTSATHDI
jgi:hypothetical protein